MAELIAIVGESGSGKTTSIRNLNPSETFIISTTGKRPGIKGARKKYPDVEITGSGITGNFYTTSNIDNIKKMMAIVDKKLTYIKTLIIDDYQYLQAFEAMARVDEKGYGKFTDMAKSYENAGVNLEAGYEVVRRIKQHVASTARKGSMGGIGSFGGMFDLASLGLKEPVLVSGTDGVGTKLKIAFAMDRHDTVGIDAVAMCVNDVLAQLGI